MVSIAPTRMESGYSRFVAVMKVALPLGAAAVVALLFSWSQIYDMPERLEIGATRMSVPDSASGHRMINARYSGTDRNRNPYTLAAESIVQQKSDPDRIMLNGPEADFTTGAGAWVAVSASSGKFAREARQVDLEGNVSFYHDSGYQFQTSAATIDFSQAIAWGTAPVTGRGEWADMEAAGFRISRDESQLEFAGPARLVFFPDTKERQP